MRCCESVPPRVGVHHAQTPTKHLSNPAMTASLSCEPSQVKVASGCRQQDAVPSLDSSDSTAGKHQAVKDGQHPSTSQESLQPLSPHLPGRTSCTAKRGTWCPQQPVWRSPQPLPGSPLHRWLAACRIGQPGSRQCTQQQRWGIPHRSTGGCDKFPRPGPAGGMRLVW